MTRDFEKPGRSLAFGTNAMAATSHPASTLTAIEIMKAGGNAMDAAVAACAVQAVVEAGSTGIGGDCFALFSKVGSNGPIAYNGSGRTPAAAELAWYLQKGIRTIDRQTPHAVTVPGAVEAWGHAGQRSRASVIAGDSCSRCGDGAQGLCANAAGRFRSW